MKNQVYAPENFDVFNCDTKPVRGLNTSRPPVTIEEDVLSVLENARIVSGESGSVIETRGGMTAALSSVSTTAAFRGCWGGYLWGANYLVVAVYDSTATKTRVYATTDVAGSWTELTASSGKYGDTRLTNNDIVRFAVGPNPFSTDTAVSADALMYADGGAIRVSTATGTSGGSPTSLVTATVAEVAPQDSVQNSPVRIQQVEGSFYYNFQAGTETFTGWVSAGDSTGQTDFLLSGTGTAPNRQWRLTIGTGTDNAHVTTADFGFDLSTNFDSPQDRCLLVGVDTAYGMLWDKVGLELRTATSGGTTLVIWDPTNPDDYAPPIPIAVDNSNRTLWVFKFPKVTSAIDYNYTRFTWKAATTEAPSAAATADFWLFALTWGSAAYSDWSVAVTNFNRGSLAESPGVIYSEYITQRVQDLGGPILNGLRLPRHHTIDCLFYAKVRFPSTAEMATGLDAFNFYYRQPGQSRYRYATRVTSASYSAGWSSAGTQAAVSEVNAGPTFNYLAEGSTVYLPDAYHICAPNAAELCWANERMFVGQVSSSKSGLLISERNAPLRFRRFTEFQNGAVAPDSPVTLSLGKSNVKAITPMSSSLIGVDTVFIFTDQEVFAGSGTDSSSLQRLARVSKFGTISPYSVAEANGKVFYVDTEMQVRELTGGQVGSISRSIVDNQLAGVPAAYRKYIVAAYHNELYYLAFTPSGETTNTSILVWDDEDRVWSNDAPPKAVQGIISWFDGTANAKRLIALGPNSSTATTLSAYEYDLSTQELDLGTTAITVSISSKEWMSPDPGKWWHIGRVGMVADGINGPVAHTRVYRGDDSTGASAMTLNTGSEMASAIDNEQTINGVGHGPTYRLSASIKSKAGKRIYRWWCERSLRDRPATLG